MEEKRQTVYPLSFARFKSDAVISLCSFKGQYLREP